MSTPNRPGSRPGPSGGPDSREAEQPARPAPPEGARPGSRPQPANRPAPAAGRGPAPQGGARPPIRPAPGNPNGPARPAQGPPPPQRPPAPQGPPGAAPQRPPAPQQGQPPAGQSQPPQAPGRQPGPGQQAPGRPGGPPPNGQPPQRQAPAGQAPRQAAPQPSGQQPSASPNETVRTPQVSADSAAAGDGSRASEPARGQDQAGPAATQAMPAQQNDDPQAGPGTPPWQRGAAQRPASQGTDRQQPQNQPQTNLSGRGAALPPNGEFDRTARTAAEPTQRESTEDKTERREAARSKAAVIDGPTRHIERKDLAKDMPDLSAVRHPEPSQSERAAPAAITAVASADGDPLRATIQIRKIDPWSTLKIALVIAVSLFFVWMVSVGLLYAVLDGMGVWERLNSAFTEIVNESGGGGLVSAGQVFGYAAVIGVINVVLFTALTTIGAFIYNLSSDLVGGVEVTLADRD
ncbi:MULTISPECIES: DUF3566 domain-containing protein [unclassified Rhodococcus (in: high G+C Gram-positive bacteria)]|uniref:DUF3566 domain-containing protein n=1 Tax=unclassified Rhodococcus (in: high G+C Gram-positive bacteria) TaxID=192944 RepID=UPI0029539A7B|nr:DUF3566 domain-containing protein [Rhodococcus sp. IEGM 1343]MDV8054851.1 DUF3566 domain-containing protein [Rhodococcus sp. IEGM 1343]